MARFAWAFPIFHVVNFTRFPPVNLRKIIWFQMGPGCYTSRLLKKSYNFISSVWILRWQYMAHKKKIVIVFCYFLCQLGHEFLQFLISFRPVWHIKNCRNSHEKQVNFGASFLPVFDLFLILVLFFILKLESSFGPILDWSKIVHKIKWKTLLFGTTWDHLGRNFTTSLKVVNFRLVQNFMQYYVKKSMI